MEKLLNTTEAAERLGVSVRRVVQLIKAEKLPAQKIGRDYAISAQSLGGVTIHGKAGRPPKVKAEVSTTVEKPKRAGKKGGRK